MVLIMTREARMGIPDYQEIMLPLLKMAGDGQDHSLQAAYDLLASEFKLTDEERKELLPSGRQATFENRVGWARLYLEKAKLLEKPKRAHFCLTERGQQVLEEKPSEINVKYLKKFSEFSDFYYRRYDKSKPMDTTTDDSPSVTTPEETLEQAYQNLRINLAQDLLDTIKNCSASFFESLVVDLLVKMGYGGSRKEAGQAIGKAGDEGIDGIIKEDRLGLDIIYIQAKKWDNTVGRPEVQKFAGALQGKRAKKGIFLTTSNFSRAALEYASSIDIKIILIDGERLAELMIDHNVGVTPVASYKIKRIDSDYFDEG
jgi:restriction system protein